MSNIDVICYETASGKITGCKHIQTDMIVANTEPGESVLLNQAWVDAASNYVDTSALEVIPRPAMDLNGIVAELSVGSTMTITNVPAGTELTHPGGIDVIDDGEIEWSTNFVGSYGFRLVNFPYQEIFFHVQVVP